MNIWRRFVIIVIIVYDVISYNVICDRETVARWSAADAWQRPTLYMPDRENSRWQCRRHLQLTSYETITVFLPRDAVQLRPMLSCGVRPSVCPTRSRILSKRVIVSPIFWPSSSQTILVFPYQTSWQYSDGTAPPPFNGVVECRWGRHISRFWANIWLQRVLWTVRAPSAIHWAATDQLPAVSRWHLSLVSGRIYWWRETTTKCMTRSLMVTPKTTEHHLIVRSGKSEA